MLRPLPVRVRWEAVDRVSVGVLLQDGTVLLGHRHPKRRWYPDCWDLIGGHIEEGESAGTALRREFREELGIKVIGVEPVLMPCSDPSIELHAFRVLSWTGDLVNRAPEEHDDLRWFRPEELDGLTLADPAIRQTLETICRLS